MMKKTVLEYLENTVSRVPNVIALTDEKGDVSFQTWMHQGKIIANAIESRDIGRQQPILVYIPKSAMTLICFVGILYSGNYYTPTDVNFPFEKMNSIAECLKPQLIITYRANAKKLLENGIDESLMIFLDDLDFSKNPEPIKGLRNAIDTDLAYVFFTSGSTGVPKGVSITHRSIIDYIDWANTLFHVDENTRIANQAPFYFDNSILDLYLCMSRGAHLYIVPELFYSFPVKLLNYLNENQINFIFWVPSALVGVANSQLLEKIDCSCLRTIAFCGEVMPNRHLNYWRRLIPNAMYVNLYGPTEITDACTYFVVEREFDDEEALPIGFPCENTDIILLDENNHRIIEPDQMGELCVRGTCLAVGYYNNPEKTNAAFVQNPLNPHYPERIYRTGDLAHYNNRGEIMFDGRRDFQIKHRGYRIELGEIETAILSIEGVFNACCIYDTVNGVINAFYTKKENLSDLDIKKGLMNILPKYMIPGKMIALSELPLNDNGKVDRIKLKKTYID